MARSGVFASHPGGYNKTTSALRPHVYILRDGIHQTHGVSRADATGWTVDALVMTGPCPCATSWRAAGTVRANSRTHGSRANWHPHLHLLVTDGGFRPDGTFVSWPAHDTARLTEAFRRAVLRLFVRLELFDAAQAADMLTWPHSGFHVHTAVWVSEDDRAFATRLARYCARNPVVWSGSRMTGP